MVSDIYPGVLKRFRSLFPQCTACKSRLFLGLPHFCIDFSQFLSASLTSLRARCRGLKGWPKRRWPRTHRCGHYVLQWLTERPLCGRQEEVQHKRRTRCGRCPNVHLVKSYMCVCHCMSIIRTCALCTISIILHYIYTYVIHIYMHN